MATETRLPLVWRIGASCALIVALAVSAVATTAWWGGKRAAAASAAQGLERAAQAQERAGAQRLRMLELNAATIANDPALASYLAASIGDDLGVGGDAAPDVASLRDLLAERRQQFGFDLGVLLDAKAHVLTRTDRGEAVVQALDRDPLLAAALRELAPQSGYWIEEAGLYQATALPLTQNGSLLGFLLLGQRVDDAACAEMAHLSGADVAIWSASQTRPRLLATSLRGAEAEHLRNDAAPSRPGGFDLAGRAWFRKPVKIALPGRRDGLIFATLLPEAGIAAGYAGVAKRAAVAAAAAWVAALLILLLLSRWIRSPLRRLAAAGEAAAAGDYDTALPVRGRDEVARLAQAMGALLSSLREKRDMEAYVAHVSRHVPDAESSTTHGSSGAARTRDSGAVLRVGSRLGARYEILDLLGSGGMGVVYKVRDLELGDVAALKLLRSHALQDAEQVERLKEEIRLARRITHPNVLRTFDFGEADGFSFITMEYVRGVTLRALLEQSGKLPYNAGLRIARQLAAGLAAAHEVGVLHRDIKPENLILESGGDLKLMDFGIARPVHRSAGLTQVGMVVGSPDYAPPEQITGGLLDQRADIYACGVVLSELFCGKRPYRGFSAAEIYMAQMSDEPVKPSTWWPDIPPALEALILRCIAVDPENRYRNAAELERVLAGLKA